MKQKIRLQALARLMTCVMLAIALPSFAEDSPSDNTAQQSGQIETVNVVLKEWRINMDKQEVRAGPVTFQVNNRGDEKHELVIVKTKLHHKALPVNHGKVTEAAAGELIGEIEEFPSSEARQATFTLTSGSYVLLCNMVEKEKDGVLESHYQEGMHVPFTVLR